MHTHKRIHISSRWGFRLSLLSMLVVGLGCHSLRPVHQPYVPHPRQRVWVNEAAVINLVTRLVYDNHFESRQKQTELRYAAVLRYWYKHCSLDGADLDGGIRALNYIRKIHFDAGGDSKLWQRVVERAKKPEPMQDGLPIPPEFD